MMFLKSLVLALAGASIIAGAASAQPSTTKKGSAMTLTVQDQLDLYALPARYGNAMDDRDWEALKTIFTHDALFEVLPSHYRMVGLDGIIAHMERSTTHPVSHLTVNVAFEVKGDEVELRFRGLLPVGEAPNQPAPYRVAFGFYYDTVVKTSEGWRVKRRVFTRAPRDMKPTAADIARGHALLPLLEADKRDAAEWQAAQPAQP